MSRHNRRRRRTRHNRNHDGTAIDFAALQDAGCMAFMGLHSTSQKRPLDFARSLSWAAGAGAHARSASELSSNHAYSIKSPETAMLKHKQHAPIHSHNTSVGSWQSHKAIMDHDQECDSICKGMANVVEYLFDGFMDYDDDEMERRAASSKRMRLAANYSHTTPFSHCGFLS